MAEFNYDEFLKNIRVYNPTWDGITPRVIVELKKQNPEIADTLEKIIMEGIKERVLKSAIVHPCDLSDMPFKHWLYSQQDGIFAKKPEVQEVLVLNGAIYKLVEGRFDPKEIIIQEIYNEGIISVFKR